MNQVLDIPHQKVKHESPLVYIEILTFLPNVNWFELDTYSHDIRALPIQIV